MMLSQRILLLLRQLQIVTFPREFAPKHSKILNLFLSSSKEFAIEEFFLHLK